jgi:hypothetical protein
MKWHKGYFNNNTFPAFFSDCGIYKAVNYGGKVMLFHRILHKKNMPFGDSVEHDNWGRTKTYKSYREVFRVIDNK